MRTDPVTIRYVMMGDYQQAALHDVEEVQVIRNCSLWMLGRQPEAIAGLRETLAHTPSVWNGC